MKSLFLLALLGLSSVGNSALPEHSLFVVMGGRTSCGSKQPPAAGIGMHRPFQKMVGELKKENPNANIDYLVSCLNSSPPPSAKAPYITSEDPKKSHEGNANVLESEISRLAAKYDDTEIFMVGHSYGGWLAMYLAERTPLKNGIRAFFTVDAISTLCGPMEYVFGSDYCHQAPRDRDNTAIVKNSRRWVNFYQDDDGMLHSSDIPEATNHRIDFRGAHTQIDNDPRTWEIIKSEVRGVRIAPVVAQR